MARNATSNLQPRAACNCTTPLLESNSGFGPQLETSDSDLLISPARRYSSSGSDSHDAEDAVKGALSAQRINRKIDLALLPVLSLLYLCNGLDRGNIGNAETQGFTHDIGCVPDDLNFSISMFYLTFVLFQPLSAAVGGWIGPRHWIPIIMFAWGGITFGQAFIWGRGALVATRLLLGVFEAGFYPMAVAYLALFYPPFDLAARIALFYGQYAVASAFSGAIAYAIFQIQHPVLKAWQILFIIQGAFTCLLAIVAWVWLPAGPGTAWFLSEEQRAWIQERNRSKIGTTSRITRRDIIETWRDWKLWFVLIFNICASVPSTAFSVFLPIVVQGMGYTSVEANLMSVPPAICGTVGLYLFAVSSDRRRERGHHVVGAILIALVGLVAVVTAPTDQTKYAALCVFLFGSYVSSPLTSAWLSGNTPAAGKRALVLGVNGWGNLAGVIGAQLFRADYAPTYRTPFLATLAFVAVALAGYLGYRSTLQAVNRRRASIMKTMSAAEIETERRDSVRYADRKWTFVYGL